jgi:hypothetical protein
MLINKMGIESDDEIVELDRRRVIPDPKNRVTMTMLLQVAMTAVPRSELLAAPPKTSSPISVLGAVPIPASNTEASRTDAA